MQSSEKPTFGTEVKNKVSTQNTSMERRTQFKKLLECLLEHNAHFPQVLNLIKDYWSVHDSGWISLYSTNRYNMRYRITEAGSKPERKKYIPIPELKKPRSARKQQKRQLLSVNRACPQRSLHLVVVCPPEHKASRASGRRNYLTTSLYHFHLL